jgi:hypothetical protein
VLGEGADGQVHEEGWMGVIGGGWLGVGGVHI